MHKKAKNKKNRHVALSNEKKIRIDYNSADCSLE